MLTFLSSPCGLIYKTTVPKERPVGKDISGGLIPLVLGRPENSVLTSSKDRSNTTSSGHTEPQVGPSGPRQSTVNSNKSKEIKVRTKNSKAKERLKSKDVPEDNVSVHSLKHFKRVQISDSDTLMRALHSYRF
jgi:hypothetical protein